MAILFWISSLVLVNVVAVTVDGQELTSGLQATVTLAGLSHINKAVIKDVSSDLQNYIIPSQSGQSGNLRYSFNNIRMSEVRGVSSHISLRAGSGIYWSGTVNSMKVSSDYSASYEQDLWLTTITIPVSGHVTVSLSGSSASLLASLGATSSGSLWTSLGDCSSRIGSVDLSFSGSGLLNWILESLSGVFEPDIKRLIQNEICDAIDKEVRDASMSLGKIPTTVTVNIMDIPLTLDYSFTQVKVTGSSVEALHKGELMWQGKSTVQISSTYPFPLTSTSSMIGVSIREEILNNLLAALVPKGEFNGGLGIDNVSPEYQHLFNVTCTRSSEFCLGQVMPMAEYIFPKQLLAIKAEMTTARLTVMSGFAQINVTGKMTFKTNILDQPYTLLSTLLDVFMPVQFGIRDHVLGMRILSVSGRITIDYSAIGKVATESLSNALDEAKKQLRRGVLQHLNAFNTVFPIDLPSDLDVKDTSIQLYPGIINVKANLCYKEVCASSDEMQWAGHDIPEGEKYLDIVDISTDTTSVKPEQTTTAGQKVTTEIPTQPVPTRTSTESSDTSFKSSPFQKYAGLRMLITRQGLRQINGGLVRKFLAGLSGSKFSDYNGRVGDLSYTLSNLRIAKHSAIITDVLLISKQGMKLTENLHYVDITASYATTYFWTFSEGSIPLTFGGMVTGRVKDVKLSLTVKLGLTQNGTFTLDIGECVTTVGGIRLDFNGSGVLDTILERMTGYFTSRVEEVVKEKVCSALEREVERLSNRLEHFKYAFAFTILKVPVVMDYSMLDIIITKDYIATLHPGEIVSSDQLLNISSVNPLPGPQSPRAAMLLLSVREEVLNNVFVVLLPHGQFSGRLNKKSLSQKATLYAELFSLSCDKTVVCLGRLLPEAAKRFPDAFLEISSNISYANLSVTSDKAILHAGGRIYFLAVSENKEVTMFSASVDLVIPLKIGIRNNLLTAKLLSISGNVVIDESAIGKVFTKSLEGLWTLASQEADKVALDSLQKYELEFPIEIPEALTLIGTTVFLRKGVIQVETNICGHVCNPSDEIIWTGEDLPASQKGIRLSDVTSSATTKTPGHRPDHVFSHQEGKPSGTSISPGATGGIVVGIVVILVLGGVVLFFLFRRRRMLNMSKTNTNVDRQNTENDTIAESAIGFDNGTYDINFGPAPDRNTQTNDVNKTEQEPETQLYDNRELYLENAECAAYDNVCIQRDVESNTGDKYLDTVLYSNATINPST